MRAVLLARRGPLGGDTLQLRETAEVLRAGGWTVDVVERRRDAHVAPGDTLHVWNVQRATDWGEPPPDVRIVVTPLLHPTDAYHRRGRAGLDAVGARLVPDPERWSELRRGPTRAVAARWLAAADLVLLSHAAEADLLADWCGVRPTRTAAVPPAVLAQVEGAPERVATPQEFALCVGRIEPLKAPRLVQRAAARAGLPVVFVGERPRGRHLLYGRAFRRSARHWLGPRAPATVRDLMERARVHVLASWTEVLGRVSVEAALAGCAVVATDVGHLPALLGRDTPGLFLVPPGDETALTEALAAAWAHGRAPDGPLARRARSLTWEVVGPRLLEAYG